MIDTQLRAFLNRRLGDIRTQMRQEFGQSLDAMKRILDESHVTDRRDLAVDTVRLLSGQKDAVEGFKAFNSQVSTVENEIRVLQQAIEDIQNGVGNQAMVRTQIRGIAQQLLEMTGQQE